MPELYIKLFDLVKSSDLETARQIQNDCCRIIYKTCSGHGNKYGVIKEILRYRGGPDCGGVRALLTEGSFVVSFPQDVHAPACFEKEPSVL